MSQAAQDGRITLHATSVALTADRGLLILGASGAGKSGLALQLMALGARLVADDRTILWAEGGALLATAPSALRGLVEARGLGLLRADALDRARIIAAVDLDRPETDRLPPRRRIVFCGCEIDLVHGVAATHFPAALLQYMTAGRQA